MTTHRLSTIVMLYFSFVACLILSVFLGREVESKNIYISLCTVHYCLLIVYDMRKETLSDKDSRPFSVGHTPSLIYMRIMHLQ